MSAFLVNGYLRSMANRYWEAVLPGILPLQDLQAMPRLYVAPDDPTLPIGAYDTLYLQLAMRPGAVIWGASFAPLEAGGSSNDFLLQLADGDTQERFFSSHVHGSIFDVRTANEKPAVLPGMRQLANGKLNIEISSRIATAARCQLLLYVAEPGEAQ